MDVDLDDLFDTEPAQDGPTEEHAGPLFADDDDDDDNADGNAEGEQREDGQQKADDANAADPKPKKKRVSRPQPKLNGDRLCGARGIGIMEDAFSDLAFSGRGYERHDLNLLMSRMQHWAHRLFPKMPFDQTIERIEKLGKTKQVQVNVKKVRMGMNVLPTEVTQEDDPTERGEPERDAFDELIGGSPGGVDPPSPTPPAERPDTPPQATASALTEEQKERMRKNREAAQLRRMRAQFTRQQPSDEQQPAEADQETQFQTELCSSRTEAVPESNGSPSPAGRRSPEPAEAGSSQTSSRPAAEGGGAAASGTSSDVEMEEDHISGPAVGEATEAVTEQETSAPRLGGLHQMSETAPVVIGDGENEPRAVAEETDTAEDQETSVSRAGHLHQMSETVPIELDDDQETEAIVIPDDDETEVAAVPNSKDTEAIVISDDPETDAVVIPDDDETEAMLVSDDEETEDVVPHDSTEASRDAESSQETSASRAGRLHQMSETAAAASVEAREEDSEGQTLASEVCPISVADTEGVNGGDVNSTGK